jgi:hypothetical protein
MVFRLREAGEFVAVGRGVVQLPGAGVGMLSGLAVVSARAPGGAICLNSGWRSGISATRLLTGWTKSAR